VSETTDTPEAWDDATHLEEARKWYAASGSLPPADVGRLLTTALRLADENRRMQTAAAMDIREPAPDDIDRALELYDEDKASLTARAAMRHVLRTDRKRVFLRVAFDAIQGGKARCARCDHLASNHSGGYCHAIGCDCAPTEAVS
jgi:hypothetical protein